MEELRVWAPQPAAVARSTPCDASRGDRTSAVGKDHVGKSVGRFLAPNARALCRAKPRHGSERMQRFSPFPFPLPKLSDFSQEAQIFCWNGKKFGGLAALRALPSLFRFDHPNSARCAEFTPLLAHTKAVLPCHHAEPKPLIALLACHRIYQTLRGACQTGN